MIEAAHAAGHDLVREYNADGSIDPFMSCYNVFFLRGDQNPEALFIRSDCDFSEFERHATPRGASGNGGLGVYQTLVDAFAMKDGSFRLPVMMAIMENRLSTRNPAIRNAVFLRKGYP